MFVIVVPLWELSSATQDWRQFATHLMVIRMHKIRVTKKLMWATKKTSHIYFIWRLIWGACAKGKCWFAKARESNSDRESRESWHVNMYINIGDLVQQICERFAKDVRKVRESWGVQSPGVPFSWSALNGKCKAFIWKYYANHFHANMCKWEQVSKRKQKWSDPAACTSSSLPYKKHR